MARPAWFLTACWVAAVLAGCGGGGSSSSASASAPASSSALAAVASTAPTATPAATATPPETVYTVKPGDTLSRIATQNKSSIDAISKANDITDPNKIQVGQKLIIPVSSQPAGSQAPAASGAGAPAASSPALPPAASKPPPP